MYSLQKKLHISVTVYDAVKSLENGHSKNKTNILMTKRRLMKVDSIAECYRRILQYFGPALTDSKS